MAWVIIIIIVLGIIGVIVNAIRNVSTKAKIALTKSSDPLNAMEALESAYLDDIMSDEEYESQLIAIAEASNSPDVMRKLVEFYSKSNPDKANYWSKRAILHGDIDAITDYYGFTDYDVSSSDYAEILSALGNVTDKSDMSKYYVNYCKGIVYYKTGEISSAKQMVVAAKDIANQTKDVESKDKDELFNACNYMLLLCNLKEGNIVGAEKFITKLKDKNFEIMPEEYLKLYNCYVQKRNSGSPDYEMELAYAENYASCQDADPQKANQICGDSYYNLAKSYETGANGFEKDIKKAADYYDRAASCEHTEALYYCGVHSWIADNCQRNYSKANNYLNMANIKGHKGAGEFLKKYGVDNILVIPVQAEAKTYRFMYGHELTAPVETINWLHIYGGVNYCVFNVSKMFLETYLKNITSFDSLMANIHQLYSNHIALMLKWCVLLLMRFDIDTYSAQDILEMCDDLSLLPQVPIFEQGLERIDDRAEQLNIQTAYSQASRGTWVGSGFGTTIRGTIKAGVNASIAAGVMNIGSGILHGIGDSIVESINNSEIKNMCKALFEKKSTGQEFFNAVFNSCCNIRNVVMEILEKQTNIDLPTLEGEITFAGEQLSTINDRTLDAKIENNTAAGKHEYAYALLIEKLRRDPFFDQSTFQNIVALSAINMQGSAEENINTLVQYSGDFMVDIQKVLEGLKQL